jgi:hypothetical protein
MMAARAASGSVWFNAFANLLSATPSGTKYMTLRNRGAGVGLYVRIERALWALAPALLLLLIISIPSTRAAREQAEADVSDQIASENLEYCTKWGMPAGTSKYVECVRDELADDF